MAKYSNKSPPEVQFVSVASTVQHEELELAEDLRHHPGEGEALWEGGVCQLQVLIREHLQHTVVLIIRTHLDGIVVVTVEDLPVGGREFILKTLTYKKHFGQNDVW